MGTTAATTMVEPAIQGSNEPVPGMANEPATVVDVADVLAVVERVVTRFDPALVSASDAMSLVSVFDRIERLGAAGKALAAGRVAGTSAWKGRGHSSAAHWMAKQTGTGVGDAIGLLKTVDALQHCDATAEAFQAGRLSRRQAKVIADANALAPGVEAELLSAADRLSVRELEDKARRVTRAGSGESESERRQRIRGSRRLRTWTDGDGSGYRQWRLPAAEHAAVMAEIDARRERIFNEARLQGRHEPVEAYAADALVAFVAGGAPAENCPPRTSRGVKVIVRVDHSALLRGEVQSGDICEIAGIGPVDVDVVRDWVQGDAFKAAIVTDGVDIRSVVHLGRRPIELQRTALEWHNAATCTITGCTSTARTEIDHVADWALTRRTTLDHLAQVCGHHHDLKTHHGYQYGPPGPDGKRELIPPLDRPTPHRPTPAEP